jgi:DNA-directed RNA polymerase subunit RPC12/RpoP
MRNLDGMEMFCFNKSKHFEIEYRGKGLYGQVHGDDLRDVMDVACFNCSTSYYTQEGDAIAFCPNCGSFERKRFADEKQITEFLRGQDFTWLSRNGMKPFVVKTYAGQWELKFARDAMALESTGAYDRVKPL